MTPQARRLLPFGFLLLSPLTSLAGGPRELVAPGTPLKWATSAPVAYQVDPGRLGNLANEQAVMMVQEAFDALAAVPTTAIRFQMTTGLPVDVTEQNWSQFFGVAGDGRSPIIFDTDGRILDQLLGLTARNDFEGASRFELTSGSQIQEASILINGACFDGISDTRSPCELRSLDELRALLLHEAGHFCNLDHSDLNRPFAENGDTTDNAVLPTMYPVNTEDDSSLAVLNLDDRLALSNLYPRALFPASGGGIEGRILDPSGTPVNGANVIARNQADAFMLAVSTVSGSAAADGSYRFAGLPPGIYTVEVAPVGSAFVGRSSVGPLTQGGSPVHLPGPREFRSAPESADGAVDNPDAHTLLEVLAGATFTGRDIILNSLIGLTNDPIGIHDGCLTATRLSENGATVADRIVTGGPDFFTIFLRAGWKLLVDLDASDPDMDSSLAGRVGLFRSVGGDCQNITSSAVRVPDPGSGEMLSDPAFEFLPSIDGDVVIGVTSVGDDDFTGAGSTVGPYYLRVVPEAPVVASQESIASGGGEASGGSGSSAVTAAGGCPGTVSAGAEDAAGTIVSVVTPPIPLPDADGDGLADAVDPCPTSPDADGDAVCDVLDNCVAKVNAGQRDGNDNGAGDACDAPTVLNLTPADNSFSVALSSSVAILFSEPIDVASLQGGGPSSPVSLSDSGGTPVVLNQSTSPEGATVILDPVLTLAPGTGYTLNVASSVVDLDTPPRSVTFTGATFHTTGSSIGRPTVAVDRIGSDLQGSSSDGAATGDFHGASLSSAGNVNGDAFSDTLIGNPGAAGGAASSGMVTLRLGAPGAVGGTAQVSIDFIGEQRGEEAGRSVAFAGDVDGDGIGDILIGAPGASPTGSAATGAAYLVFGRSDWSLVATPVHLASIGNPSCAVTGVCGIVLAGLEAGDRAGAVVSFGGDVNLDGRLDILVGAPARTIVPQPSDVRTHAGAVYLIFGGPALETRGTIDLSSVGGSVPGVAFLGENSGDAAGSALSDWRDRTMDGVDDLLIGSPSADVIDAADRVLADAGIIHMVRGVAGMPSGTVDLRDIGGSIAGAVLLGATAGARAGEALSGHHDVTGDGEFDALLGASRLSFPARSSVGAGIVVPSLLADPQKTPLKGLSSGVICLGATLPDTPPPAPVPAAPRTLAGCADAGAELEATLFMGETMGDEAGTALDGAGDVNGDRIDDILLGAPGADVSTPGGPLTDAGRVYLILGEAFRSSGPVALEEIGVSQSGVVFEGRTASGRLGAALAGGGDIDGSLSTEILLAAPGDPGGPPDAGHVYVTAPYVMGEPGELRVTGGTTATLEWTRATGAARHRVYRGDLGTLRSTRMVATSAAVCLTPGTGTDGDADADGKPDLIDTTLPPLGRGFWYLTTGESLLGEGSLGTDSAGSLRRNDGPCM